MTFTVIFKNKESILDIPKENYTIKELLEDLELDTHSYVFRKNDKIVIDESVIEDGDIIKIIQILYGG